MSLALRFVISEDPESASFRELPALLPFVGTPVLVKYCNDNDSVYLGHKVHGVGKTVEDSTSNDFIYRRKAKRIVCDVSQRGSNLADEADS